MNNTKTKRNLIGSIGLLSALVVVAAPVFVAQALTDTSIVTVIVDKVISVSSANTVSFTVIPTTDGVLSNDSDIVTVSTNSTLGYNLSISASDATAVLTGSPSGTIPASANTYATPAVLANNTWGYAVPSLGAFDASYATETNSSTSTSKWAGMPILASLQNIKSTSSVASGDTTTVWYAAKANFSTPAGTFTDIVTYTALAK